MKRSSPVYRLYLVPVDDDGTISASFLEEAKGAAPRVSKEQPVDLTAARALVLSELPVIQGVCRRLGNLAEVLPVSADRDAMFDDRVPCDATSFIFGTIDHVVRETLPSAIEPLHRAATVTDDELVRDFLERQARYLAEQTRRLRKGRA